MTDSARMRSEAQVNHQWLLAYMEAGFTRAEAVGFLVACFSRPIPQQMPPEMSEVLQKVSAVYNRTLAEPE
jgi:hypothetical protein